MSRTLKRSVGRALVGLLLFMQLAIAAYACPVLFPALADGPEQMMSSAAHDPVVGHAGGHGQGIGDCARTDDENPNLCASHCLYGQQTVDRAATPSALPVLLTGLYVVPLPQEASARFPQAIASEVLPTAASPPHALLHCCFRI